MNCSIKTARLTVLIITILFSFSLQISAQNYWDSDYNGQAIKKMTQLHYNSEGRLVDSIFYHFYNDGLIKSIEWNHFVEMADQEAFWNGGGEEFFYKNGEIYLTYRIYQDEVSQVSRVVEKRDQIHPVRQLYYSNEIEALAGSEHEASMTSSYNEDIKLISTKYKSEGFMSETQTIYKKGEIVKSISSFVGPDGNKNEDIIEYKVLKEEKFGWSERKDLTNNMLIKRSVELYSKNELKDKSLSAPEYIPNISVDDIMTAFRGNSYSYSPSKDIDERQASILEIGIGIISADRRAIDSTMYDPNFFFTKLYDYYMDQEQDEMAIEIANKGLTFHGDGTEKSMELNTRLSYYYENMEDYDKALSYYLKLDNLLTSMYDPGGNVYDLRKARLFAMVGDQEKSNKKINTYVEQLDKLMSQANFDITTTRYEAIIILDRVVEVLILNKRYDKAAEYLSKLKDYHEVNSGEDSDDYMRTLERMIEVKKAKNNE